MHQLLKRLLCRGPFMFLATAGLGWLLSYVMRWLVTTENSRLEGGDDWTGPICFGLLGVVVYLVLECLSYAKEKWKADKAGK